MTERAVFLFPRFDAKQKIAPLPSLSFLREVTHEASERARSGRGGRQQRDRGAGKRRAGGRERAAPAGPGTPRGHAAGGDTAAALPRMPIAASPRVLAALRREEGKRERM